MIKLYKIKVLSELTAITVRILQYYDQEVVDYIEAATQFRHVQ